jgi:hypothetical protein
MRWECDLFAISENYVRIREVSPNPHVRTAAATLAGFSARNFVGALLAARIM